MVFWLWLLHRGRTDVRVMATAHQDAVGRRMQQVAQHQAFPQSMHRPRGWSRRADTALWCAVPTSLLVLFIVIPLVALVWRAVSDPTLWSSLTKRIVLDALWVTGLTTSATLLIALMAGTPLAY